MRHGIKRCDSDIAAHECRALRPRRGGRIDDARAYRESSRGIGVWGHHAASCREQKKAAELLESAAAAITMRVGRRRWDSNPRCCSHTRFPGAPTRPLWDSSMNGPESTRNTAKSKKKPGQRARRPRLPLRLRQLVAAFRCSLAEEVGFEPTKPLRAYRFSRAAPSTTRTLFRRAV